MILGFKKQFIQPILEGRKKHSIRSGNRWREGMSIQFYTNVRKKSMYKFREDGEVTSLQTIKILYQFSGNKKGQWNPPIIFIDGRPLKIYEAELLAYNDGFKSIEHFTSFFNKDFEGQIIHWTKLKY